MKDFITPLLDIGLSDGQRTAVQCALLSLHGAATILSHALESIRTHADGGEDMRPQIAYCSVTMGELRDCLGLMSLALNSSSCVKDAEGTTEGTSNIH